MTPRARYLSSTMGLLIVAVTYFVLQGVVPRPHPRLGPPPGGVSRPAPPPRPLSAEDLLSQRAQLGLTPRQVARLESLERRWKDRDGDLEAAVAAAQEAFGREMATQAVVRTTVADLQRRSADFRELSAELRERRRLHAEAAMEVLTESQRRHVLPATAPEMRREGQ